MFQTPPIIIIIQLSFYITIVALLIHRTHLLMSSLCLEAMILRLVLLIPTSLHLNNILIPTIRIIILTFGACEARLGLRLIVLMSRTHGSDMIKSISINKC
jgi:NADH-ubiquinone oxidoreductase chain 4L